MKLVRVELNKAEREMLASQNDAYLDSLLKRFKKRVTEYGVIEECRKREFFLPNSLRRKIKSENHAKLMRKLNKNKKKFDNQ